MRGLFITGTDTGVGKTHVADLLIRGLRAGTVRVGAYKPAVSGARPCADGWIWDDVERLWRALGGTLAREHIAPQRFVQPLAPPLAARLEGRTVDFSQAIAGAEWWGDRADVLIVEGAGGLLCPLTDTETMADLAGRLGYPLVVVARAGLGTINHTLLTLEAADRRGLKVAGLVLNDVDGSHGRDESCRWNANELRRRSTVPILAEIPHVPRVAKKEISRQKVAEATAGSPSGPASEPSILTHADDEGWAAAASPSAAESSLVQWALSTFSNPDRAIP